MQCRRYMRYMKNIIKMPSRVKAIYETQDKLLHSLISAQMVAHIDKLDVVLELAKSFSKAEIIRNKEKALAYFSLINPVRSLSFNLVRIGGQTDGGYVLLCLKSSSCSIL